MIFIILPINETIFVYPDFFKARRKRQLFREKGPALMEIMIINRHIADSSAENAIKCVYHKTDMNISGFRITGQV